MQMPKNYAQTPVQGERVEVQEGGHQLIIYQVVETTSKTGRPMIVVQFDLAPGDRQAGLAAEVYKDDVSPEKKWPHFATQYILVEDRDGNTSRSFKTFCSSVEASNPGFKIAWGDGFSACFKKKLVGAVFGQVENEYQGNVTIRTELRWFCGLEKSKDAKIPALKTLNKPGIVALPAPQIGQGWMSIPDNVEDDGLPFN